MSKLEGNGRWRSKMLLPEHHEQYESRREPRRTGRPTTEELTLIRDSVLLPHMMTMVQKCMDDLRNSHGLLNRMFLKTAQVLLDLITQDLLAVRKELKRRNIKVIDEEQVDLILYHRFVCRGYEDRFAMVREVMKSEIAVRLSKYMAEVTASLGGKERSG